MSRTKRIFQNSAILITQYVIINVIAIAVVGYVARKLGHQDYGIYSLAFSFPAIFEIFGNLGLRTLTVRETARNRVNPFEYLGKIIPARIICIGIMGIMVVLSAYVMNYEKRIMLCIIISIGSTMFEQLSRIMLDIFQAFEEMGKVAIRDVTVRLFTAFSCVSVLLLGYGLYEICFAYLIGSLLGLIINVLLYLRRFPTPKFIFDIKFIICNVKEGSSFVIIGFAAMVITKLDVLILSKLTDNATVGVYNASANLFYRLNLLSDNISTAVFPAISELYWVKRDEANSIMNKAVLIISIIALPLGTGGVILSDQIINLVYGNSYHDSIEIFGLLIITIPFMFLWTLFFYILGAVKQQSYVAKVVVFVAIFNFLSNYVLIIFIGVKGAAIATLITHSLCFILLFIGIRKYFSINLNFKRYFLIMIALSSLAFVAYATKAYGLYISIPSASLIYFLSLFILGRNEFNFSQLIKLKR